MKSTKKVISMLVAHAILVQVLSSGAFASHPSDEHVHADLSDQSIEASSLEEYTPSNTPLQSNNFTQSETIGGTCGEDLTWALVDGVLTISGTGAMDSSPWLDEHREAICQVVVEDGVTSICSYAFVMCTNIVDVSLPESLQSIGRNAFSVCSALEKLDIPEGLASISRGTFSQCYALKEISLPSSLTAIESSAFDMCTSLISIEIPDGVTSISPYAFYQCESLTDIQVDEQNSFYTAENGVLYSKDKTALLLYPIGKVESHYEVPSSVTHIGPYAFSFSQLQSISLPDTLIELGNGAFEHSYHLLELNLPDGVKKLARGSIHACTSLKTITIPASVTIIEDDVFSGCHSLESLIFEGDVPEIGDCALEFTITTAYYPCTNESWTADAMQNYGGAITWKANHQLDILIEGTEPTCTESGLSDQAYCSICDRTLNQEVLPARHKFIDSTCTFCNAIGGICGSDVQWTLVDHVLTISGTGPMLEFAFAGAPWDRNYRNDIYEAIVEDEVTTVANWSFSYCQHLRKVTISNSATRIGYYAFEMCRALTEVSIPASVTLIDECAFIGCENLSTIHFMGDAPEIMYYAFHSVTATAYYPCGNHTWTSDTMQNYDGTLSWTAEHCFEDNVCTMCGTIGGTCGSNASWTLIDGVLTIRGTGAMMDFSSENSPWAGHSSEIKKVVVEHGITTIGDWAFEACTALEELSLPDTLTSIGFYAFGECSSLQEVTLPNQLLTIAEYAFSGCTALEEITFPYGLISIARQAFRYCSALREIHFPETLQAIGNQAFLLCTSLVSVDIPASVTQIGVGAFSRCSSLTEIRVSAQNAAYTSVDGVLFNSDFTTLLCYPAGKDASHYDIPAGVSVISSDAFSESQLTSINIPDSVTEIGGGSFSHCKNLTSLTIPKNVTWVDWFVFENCTSLTSLIFEGDAPTFVAFAFWGLTATAYYPCANDTWTTDVLQSYDGNVTWAKQHGSEATLDAVPATCTEAGLTEGKYCTRCTEVTVTQTHVPATGHSYVNSVTNPTCTAQGYTTHTCSSCGNSYVDSYVSATGHSYGAWNQIQAPSCTEKGTERRDCSNCSHYETRETNATGHSLEHWTQIKAPTCTDTGTERRDCSNCNYYETRMVNAKGHNYTSSTTAPTCTTQGYTTHTCSTCSNSYVDTYVNATGHKFDNWSQTKAPTCTEAGNEKRACTNTNCTHTETRTVAPTGHSYAYVDRDGLKTGTCQNGCGSTTEQIGTPTWRVENDKLVGTEYTTGLVLIALYGQNGRLITTKFCTQEEQRIVNGTTVYRYSAPEFTSAELSQAHQILCFNLSNQYSSLRGAREVR